VGDVRFGLKFALKLTHPPLKSADFNQYLLITSEPQELAGTRYQTNLETTLKTVRQPLKTLLSGVLVHRPVSRLSYKFRPA